LLACLLAYLPPDPLAVSRGLAESADLRAWLSTRELAPFLGLIASTICGWSDGTLACWYQMSDA